MENHCPYNLITGEQTFANREHSEKVVIVRNLIGFLMLHDFVHEAELQDVLHELLRKVF